MGHPTLRGTWRLVRRPAATLRAVRAIGAGAGPQLGRQIRVLTDERTSRDLVATLLHGAGVAEVAVVRDDVLWRTDLGDEVGRSLFRDGTYAAAEVEAVLAWLASRGRSGTVVEVGANIGTTTVPLARAGFAVLAVEPVPATHALLVANVAAAGVADRVTTAAVAVAEETGSVAMWVGFGSGRSEVAAGDGPPDMRPSGVAPPTRVEVPTAPLDRLMADAGVAPADVALVWADVQGCETAVIATADALWEAGVPIWLEVDPQRLERQAGLDRFLATVAARFSAFLARDDVLAGADRPVRPIAGFPAWTRSIPDGRYQDALLLP